jgi:DNA-binding GntR family transcriptional regulator
LRHIPETTTHDRYRNLITTTSMISNVPPVDTEPYTEPSTGSYPVVTDVDPVPAPSVGQAALRRDEVYGELRRRLMLGQFGLRTRLVEERLANTLGVSRTPVREALLRLSTEGLVAKFEGGYFVVLPDLTQLRDLYDLRITLEVRGLTRVLGAGSKHDSHLLEPLRDAWLAMADHQPEPDPMFVTVDESFHVTLLRSTGNEVLTDSLEQVNARIRAVRMYDFLTERRIEQTISEHLGIVELVLLDKVEEALRSLQIHVGESMEVVERRAARAIMQMALKQSAS